MQDRVPLYPGRVTLTPVSGQANTFDLTRADQPTQEGTPLNKASLLKDATAALFGKTNAAVPDDILNLLSKSALAQIKEKYVKKTTLEDIPVGTVISLNENGSPVDFYVAAQNYESELNGTGKVLLVRKDCYSLRPWSSASVNTYATSTINTWLNSTYKSGLDSSVQSAMGTTQFKSAKGNGDMSVGTLTRSVFLLSLTEFGVTHDRASIEGSALSIASTLKIARLNGNTIAQWTRSPNSTATENVFYFGPAGATLAGSCTDSHGVRPAFTLPATFPYTWYSDSSGNAYTEQEYETKVTDVLGNLISIPADQIKDGVKIATGSYTGTGTYGSSNPNSLTFEFEPKLIMISDNPTSYPLGRDHFGMWFAGIDLFISEGTGSQGNQPIVNISGNIIRWYASSAVYQLNNNGKEYHYIAIG